ncbi:hypothetical protein V8F33_003848 [Rhypophila sp. PSN 637]
MEGVDVDSLPEVLKFVGVKFDVQEEKAELAAKREAKRAYWNCRDAYFWGDDTDNDRLPAWFHRIRRLDIDASLGRRPELQPRDFDEDLSDIEEDGEEWEDVDEDEEEEEEGEKVSPKCDEIPGYGPDCDCEPIDEEEYNSEDEDSDAAESERSYCGSEADFYYEMKKMREARKRQLLLEKKKAFAEELRHERAREKEILDAIGAIRQQQNNDSVNEKGGGTSLGNKQAAKITTELEPLPGKTFRLFCSDLTGEDLGMIKYVRFYHSYGGGQDDTTDEIQEKNCSIFKLEPNSSSPTNGQVHGAMCIGRQTSYEFEPFLLWNQKPKAITVKTKPEADGGHLEAESGGHVNLTFNIFGNDHVELELTRESLGALSDIPIDYLNFPEVLRFVGVKCDLHQEAAERATARWAARRAARSPSPRRTWFEMNHPMGWYKQSRDGLFGYRG